MQRGELCTYHSHLLVFGNAPTVEEALSDFINGQHKLILYVYGPSQTDQGRVSK